MSQPISMTIEQQQQQQQQPTDAGAFSSKEDESIFLTQIQEAMKEGGTILPSADIPVIPLTQWSADARAVPTALPPPAPHAIRLTDQEMFPSAYVPSSTTNLSPPKHWTDNVYEEFRIPFFLIFMYFLFQLPFFRNLLRNYFHFLFQLDGNYNLLGLISVSILYGMVYYFSIQLVSNLAHALGGR